MQFSMLKRITIPTPSREARVHSARLVAWIAEKINQASGAIPFSEYMQHVLYAHQLGYYTSGNVKFGSSGDFVTASDFPLFGCTLAHWISDTFERLQGSRPMILEFGAGTGQLAVMLLKTLEAIGKLPALYQILEISPDLKARQKQLLEKEIPHLLEKVCWISKLPQTPFCGVLIANEVLDAFPVQRFHVTEENCSEIYVGYENNQFKERLRPSEDPELQDLANFIRAGHGVVFPYISERNPFLKAWLQSLSSILTEGAALLIDYGFPKETYYHPDRNRGTLMCHYRHHAHTDPYVFVGLQDLSAHVDFGAVSEYAVLAGFEIAQYTTQASFLIQNGILDHVSALGETELQKFTLNQSIKLLTLPHEMGELFKVMVLSKAYDRKINHP